MPNELKPCPFCGRKPSKVREHHVPSISNTFYTVECKAPLSKCGTNPRTRYFASKESAVDAWNRRANDVQKDV